MQVSAIVERILGLVLRINMEGEAPELAGGERINAHSNSNASAPPPW
jgi:hypothetical protein